MSTIKYLRPKIRSRHPSHSILRKKGSFPLFPFKSVIRLGSFTKLKDDITSGGDRLELNTVEAINNSADKLLMKQCFTKNKVKTADWWRYYNENIFHNTNQPFDDNFDGNAGTKIEDLPFPIIAKHRMGSKGRGNYKLDSLEALKTWLESRKNRLNEYIFEKFYNYIREYRLHVTKEGCFYTCRKMLKSNTPNNAKWYRNDDHCVWIMEENELFDKPTNWSEIVKHSVRALNAVGLDFGAVDVKIQSSKKDNPEFIIIEINSAPSFGEVTSVKYLEILPQLLLNKKNKINEN